MTKIKSQILLTIIIQKFVKYHGIGSDRKQKNNFCKNPKFATINGKICCVNCDQYVENDKTKEQELCKLRKEESEEKPPK